MPSYDIEYVYTEPMAGLIENFPADDEEIARELALKEIEMVYPEAQDIEITRVTVVN